MAIYDTMEYIRPDVSTVCIGQAASMGSLLLTAGQPGKDIAFKFPNNDPPTIWWFSRSSY